MLKLCTLFVVVLALAAMLTSCASTGKHVKDTVDNVKEYALFGDEYCRW